MHVISLQSQLVKTCRVACETMFVCLSDCSLNHVNYIRCIKYLVAVSVMVVCTCCWLTDVCCKTCHVTCYVFVRNDYLFRCKACATSKYCSRGCQVCLAFLSELVNVL